jgi:cytochrome c biogenesis protein CcmG/thiol:disulfide interchange protein DsbE
LFSVRFSLLTIPCFYRGSYNKAKRFIAVSRRNTLVLTAVLFILAIFAWAGWANWEYRQQAVQRRQAMAAQQAELIPATALGTPEFVSPLKDKPAPSFTLEDLSGKKVSLASYKGKALLINFWATWCGPCKIETPWLIQLRDKYASQGFEVLGIDSEGDDAKPGSDIWNKDQAAIAKFAQQEKVPYPVLVDGDSISEPYGGLEDLPTSFYVDRKGTVIVAQVGINSESDIEANIKKALGE